MSNISLSNPIDTYNQYGFAVVRVFDEIQVQILEKFAKDWLYRLLSEWTAGKEHLFPLETYHIWSKSQNVEHGGVFRALNRYLYPDPEIANTLVNEALKTFLRNIGLEQYQMWDDGWGWVGFRFIRPGVGDGYPLSKKAWGKARDVVSCWVPVIGYDPSETLTLVPGSHLLDYEKYLPTDGKFTQGECRLVNPPGTLTRYNPKLARGEIVVYHPETLHSEDVVDSNITRLNLEFRLKPVAR